jgi:hypothetical protein
VGVRFYQPQQSIRTPALPSKLISAERLQRSADPYRLDFIRDHRFRSTIALSRPETLGITGTMKRFYDSPYRSVSFPTPCAAFPKGDICHSSQIALPGWYPRS